MRLKQYLKILEKMYPTDSDDPTVIVQQLACLAGIRLSHKGGLPKACGRGLDLDMDIINEGVVTGLEKLRRYDGEMGSIRAYLYPSIAGAMRHYAWKRENRVTHGEWEKSIHEVYPAEMFEGYFLENEDGETLIAPIAGEPDVMLVDGIEDETIQTETVTEDNQRLGLRLAALATEDRRLLLRYGRLGKSNGTGRTAMAEEMGINVPALRMRVQRIKEKLL